MSSPIYIILTTYQREELAQRTIESTIQNLKTSLPLQWILVDDGSGGGYLDRLINYTESLGGEVVYTYNSQRKGVGHGMNTAIRTLEHRFGGTQFLMLEDDWELVQEFNLDPSIRLLSENDDIGMVRFGYLSPGLQAQLFVRSDELWWDILPNGYQYRFTGHPSLRHIRFHQQYGFYPEGLAPGATELGMCGLVNAKPNGPKLVLPVYYQQKWGAYHHGGTHSLASIQPEIGS